MWLLRVGPARRLAMPRVRVGTNEDYNDSPVRSSRRRGCLEGQSEQGDGPKRSRPGNHLGNWRESCLAPRRLRSLNSPPCGSFQGFFTVFSLNSTPLNPFPWFTTGRAWGLKDRALEASSLWWKVTAVTALLSGSTKPASESPSSHYCGKLK